MIAIDNNGQLYFTFEDLDLDLDLESVLEELIEDKNFFIDRAALCRTSTGLKVVLDRISVLSDVIFNVHRLIRLGAI